MKKVRNLKDYRCFICYATKDKKFVERLANQLLTLGVKVWFDEYELLPGDSLHEKLEEGLRKCKCGAVVLSPNFFLKKWPKRELGAMLQLDASKNKSFRIIPIWLGKIDSNFIRKRYPMLVDIKAVKGKGEIEAVANELVSGIKEIRKNIVSPLRIAIGVTQKNRRILMVRRKEKEGNLLWQFPAGIIKPNEDPRRVLINEIKKETNISCDIISKIGERIHPDTRTFCIYYSCQYIKGDIVNLDSEENSEAKWIDAEDVEKYITSDLYLKVKRLIKKIAKE